MPAALILSLPVSLSATAYCGSFAMVSTRLYNFCDLGRVSHVFHAKINPGASKRDGQSSERRIAFWSVSYEVWHYGDAPASVNGLGDPEIP
jgi:hypothetical protein